MSYADVLKTVVAAMPLQQTVIIITVAAATTAHAQLGKADDSLPFVHEPCRAVRLFVRELCQVGRSSLRMCFAPSEPSIKCQYTNDNLLSSAASFI